MSLKKLVTKRTMKLKILFAKFKDFNITHNKI